MSKIRSDLFPKMSGFLESKEKTIERWIDEAFSALDSLFSSKENFVNYLNSLKNHMDAELLIRTSQFYLVAKKYQHESYVKLIMIISVIEKMANREKKYQEFYHWIESQDSKIEQLLSGVKSIDAKKFKETIRLLAEDYFQIFGSRRNVLDFFKRHLSHEDKVKIITSMRANYTDVVLQYSERLSSMPRTVKENVSGPQDLTKYGFHAEKQLMPYCYDWRFCFIHSTDCIPSYGCKLAENEDFETRILKRVVDLIYQIRNDFVHDASITPLNEKNTVTLGKIGETYASIDLTTDDLQKMFEKALKHYFDELTI